MGGITIDINNLSKKQKVAALWLTGALTSLVVAGITPALINKIEATDEHYKYGNLLLADLLGMSLITIGLSVVGSCLAIFTLTGNSNQSFSLNGLEGKSVMSDNTAEISEHFSCCTAFFSGAIILTQNLFSFKIAQLMLHSLMHLPEDTRDIFLAGAATTIIKAMVIGVIGLIIYKCNGFDGTPSEKERLTANRRKV